MREKYRMYQQYFLVYLVMSIVSTAPVPNHENPIYLGNTIPGDFEDRPEDDDKSCGFNFSSSDTNKAQSTFKNYLLDKTVSVIYLFLKQNDSDQSNLERYLLDELKRNGLQEWIWLKREKMYEELSLPIDLDSLTFLITKYGTKEMDIPWSLSINCQSNTKISYENETRHIINFLWTSITKNETGSLLCHRSFDDKTLTGTKAIWYLTTVWIGYDFDCFSIDSLMDGDFKVEEQTKYDITKMLTVLLGLLGYMHPYIIHLVEIVQPNKNSDLNRYYKNKNQYEKPYGITRIMQKIFFSPWRNIKSRTNKAVKYAPIVRFYFFWTLILLALNLYKLKINKNELFEKDEYDTFPNIYRYGIPEYQFIHIPWLPFTVSIVTYCVCNIWIYILYNETEDFIICFGKDTCCCCSSCSVHSKYICCVPVKDIMETEENTDKWMLTASKKLIFRFTMLFSLKFWKFIFTYSFCSVGIRCKKGKKKYGIFCVFHNTFVGILLFILNMFLNILFCSMPSIWFIFFVLCSMKERYMKEKNRDCDKKLSTGSESSHSKESKDGNKEQSTGSESSHSKEHRDGEKEQSTGSESPYSKENRDGDKEQSTGSESSHLKENRDGDKEQSTGSESSHSKENRDGNKEQSTGSESSHSKEHRDGEKEQSTGSESSYSKENRDGDKEQSTGSERSHSKENRDGDKEQSTGSESSHSKENRDDDKMQSTGSERSHSKENRDGDKEQSTGSERSHSKENRDGDKEQSAGSESAHSKENRDGDKEQATGSESSHSTENRDGSQNRHNGNEQVTGSSCLCFFTFQFFMLIFYTGTVRGHVGFFVFLERSLAYTIISGFIASEHVWRWYLFVIFSFGYFTSYFLEFLDSYAVLLNNIFEISDKDSIDEDHFNYILDNCYTARKRFFLLIIKTVLTTIFMIVSFQILQKTGAFADTKFSSDKLSILVILISPKIVLFFAETKPSEELEKHKSEIIILYEKYPIKEEKTFDTDLYFKSFKECCSCTCSNCCDNCNLPFFCQLVYRSLCECGPCFSLADLKNLKKTMNESVTDFGTQTTGVSGKTLNGNPGDSNTTGDDIPYNDNPKRIMNKPVDNIVKTMEGNFGDRHTTTADIHHFNIQFKTKKESDIELKKLNRNSENFYRTRDKRNVTENTSLLATI